jgi:DNA-binding winged helix-turn-helix (wHTH) protein
MNYPSSPRIDWDCGDIIIGDERRHLRPKSLALLKKLVERPDKPVSPETLIWHLWGDDVEGGPIGASDILHVHIRDLRRQSPWPIRNSRGYGYIIEGYDRSTGEAATDTSSKTMTDLPAPKRSNCLWARRMRRERGGYLVSRPSAYGWWRHFLWMPPDQSGMWSYVPLNAISPEEWRKRPWWRRLFIWQIWRGRPSDLVPFRFDGHVVKEDPCQQ